jgi:hypothetical protein
MIAQQVEQEVYIVFNPRMNVPHGRQFFKVRLQVRLSLSEHRFEN